MNRKHKIKNDGLKLNAGKILFYQIREIFIKF
jgi:hypothetical protein